MKEDYERASGSSRTQGWGSLDRIRDSLRQLVKRNAVRYVFIHINKTAGSSIEAALGLPFEHKTAREKKAELGEACWNRMFKFSFVRNPWDRALSHYSYRVRTNQTGLGDRHLSFEEWARMVYSDRDPFYLDSAEMFRTQSEWLIGEDGEILVDFVGRFERLPEDFGTVCENIGVAAELPHLKRSKPAGYREFYSDVTAELVAKYFAEDVDRFGYAF